MSRVREPYCGPAPDAETLFSAWNFDPALIIVTGVALFAVHRAKPRARACLTYPLAVVLVIAFISPLCALTTALFSARAVHHILIGSIAASMIALMLPGRWGVIEKVPAEAVFLLHTVIYWLWHIPVSYDFALAGSWQYWLMQIAFIMASVWLWWLILAHRISVFSALGLTVGTMVQMGFLAAILTFAPYPIFEAHFAKTEAFGISPLEDQQVAGVLMWTIGIAPYAIATLWLVYTRLMSPAAER